MAPIPGSGLAKGLAVTLRTMTKKTVTAQYPDVQPDLPPRTRGVIGLFEENCTVCMLCARECPDWCIYIDSHKETVPATTPGGRERSRNVLDRFAIDFSLCMYCGICIEVCPFDALFWSPEFEYAETDIRELTHERDKLREWMWTVPAPPALDPAAEEPKEIAAARKTAEKLAAAQEAAKEQQAQEAAEAAAAADAPSADAPSASDAPDDGPHPGNPAAGGPTSGGSAPDGPAADGSTPGGSTSGGSTSGGSTSGGSTSGGSTSGRSGSGGSGSGRSGSGGSTSGDAASGGPAPDRPSGRGQTGGSASGPMGEGGPE